MTAVGSGERAGGSVDTADDRRLRLRFPLPALRSPLVLLALSLYFTPVSAQEPNWDAVKPQTVTHLQRLIKINSVNPPGNEMAVARYLEGVLKAARIETQLFEPSPGRAALIARLRGNGSKRPVILMAHMDVVGVEPEHWSVDPFEGVVEGGYLYGRGAIDDKGMLAANLVTMLLLKQHVVDAGGTLARDVIFVATSDEEGQGKWGIGWIVQNHPELVNAEFALNEGGRTRIVNGKPLYLAVQSTEKVPHNVRVTATGPSGHASIPLEGNAILRLGRALAAIGAHREPVRITPTSRVFFRELSKVWPDGRVRAAMADVASRERARVTRGASVLEKIPVFNAVIRNGISATMTEGGIRSNVIPADAWANLNIRTLPGESIDSVVARLRTAVNDRQVTIDVTDRTEHDPPASSYESAMFAAIRESARALSPNLAVVPYLSTGATDNAVLRAGGMHAYGILPFPMDQGDEDRMHGHDERVPLESLHFGTRLIYGAIRRVTQ
jgi:acetylornithine deacetylase/succinyl-diaminopimelate desuccinylase-like protein